MTHVSKRTLPTGINNKLFVQFTRLFSNTTQRKSSDMFEALFTDSEKTMFVKRLAVVLMLSQGYSTYAISKALMVSDSTVRMQKERYLLGEYDSLIKTTQHKDFDSKKFWKTVDVLLRLGMPSYSGKDRWKFLNT